MSDVVKLKNKGGRPIKYVDEKLVHDLASIHCTQSEIARITGVSVDTLDRRFAETMRLGMDEGKRSLRRLQWLQAEKGNVHMLIWLGKQWLGQKDRQPDEAPNTVVNVMVTDRP